VDASAIVAVVFALVCINGAPILLRNLLQGRCAFPLDGYACAWDGRRVLGPSKTWRGLFAAVITAGALAPVFGLSSLLGMGVGALAMLGDSVSSFCKRRLGLRSGVRVPLLDQMPEALLPVLWLQPWVGLSLLDVVASVIGFVVLEMALLPLLVYLHVRRTPRY